jgi:hypothetical protein
MTPQTGSITFMDALVTAIQQAGIYDKNDQTPPAAVLWPDKERNWESIIPALRSRLPLLTLGDYAPQDRTGSSYWIRCMIARTLPADIFPVDAVPVIYLPGISRGDIRAIEECPPSLQPLAELQYRGVLWTQKNGHDWTLSAFLQTKSGGLGLEVAGDQATKEAIQRALLKLADEPVEKLRKEAPLKAAFFDVLLNPDETRSLLLWLNDPAGYRLKVNLEEWLAFCSVCKARYQFHPEKDGPISAAQLFGLQEGNWKQVWARFKESPKAYPNLPSLLRQASPPQSDLFDLSESWPQDNEFAEEQLQQKLNILATFSPQDARACIEELEQTHGQRRNWVWAALGQSPLALTLESLSSLSELANKALVGATVQEITQAYLDWGWQVDQTALDALTMIQAPGNSAGDINAVKGALQALYKIWLEGSAASMQKAIATGPTSQTYPYHPLKKPEKGTCVLFSDALRLDAGQQLAAALTKDGYQVDVKAHLAALPAITSTAKCAFSTGPGKITGKKSKSLTPFLIGKETPITAEAFRKLLEEEGFQILKGEDLGDPSGMGWTEIGEIDSYGHEHGCKLAIHLQGELQTICNRIEMLVDFGWKKVIVVTDHGWLLLPGGLPKAYIPEHLTELRKGRCARLMEGAHTDQQTVPWFWDEEVQVATAPGICCYEANQEYEHGGISPQECITPLLTITKTASEANMVVSIEIPKWRGLRFTAKITGGKPGLVVDIRSKAGDASTSLVKEPEPASENGEVSLLVENEDKLDSAAIIVVIAENGQVCAQMHTTIGE